MTTAFAPPRAQSGCGYVLLGVVLVLSLCLTGAGLAWNAPTWLWQVNLPPGYRVEICYKVRVVGQTRFTAIWWVSVPVPPAFSFSPGAVCRVIPWLPVLPKSGVLTFPP